MQSELIISTYNSPDALSLVLTAVSRQQVMPHSIAVADDGSGQPTRDVIDRFARDLPLRHVWHPDDGFNKNVILNKAIAGSKADHLIFIDGDCLPAPNFIARHRELAHPCRFATGSVVRLTEQATQALQAEQIANGQVFTKAWLSAHGALDSVSDRMKAGQLPKGLSRFLDRISPARITWSGGNASGFRDALIAVNGFDETMRYGGEDKEMGARLMNAGYRGRFLRYSAPLLHMHHARGYVDPGVVAANRAKILQTRRTRRCWAETGLAQYL